jgi:PAS domain S-box-containing protein
MDDKTNELKIMSGKFLAESEEKGRRVAELMIANEELAFQNEEKGKRAAELVIANEELAFQNEEKGKRAFELVIANQELAFQNEEKEKRSKELVVANMELVFQNEEKEKRAHELVVANKELVFQNEEKQKRAHELVVANKELVFQNKEREKRADELIVVNNGLEKAEEKIKKINRLYVFISQVNQKIVHVKDENALFRNACKIALEFGKFKIAWIGMFDTGQKKITLIDQEGIPAEYVNEFSEITLQTDGPQEHVLHTDNYYICNDIKNCSELECWKQFTPLQEMQSCILLPIRKSGKIIGTFNLYASELNFFDKEEIALLTEVTGDISFAIDMFETAKRQKHTEELVVKNEKRFRALIEKSLDMKTLSAEDGKLLYASPSVTNFLGYNLEELFTKSMYNLIHPDDIKAFIEERNKILQFPDGFFHFRQRRLHKNGNWMWIEGTLTNMLNESMIHAMVTNFRDISEKKMREDQDEFDMNNLNALINNTRDLMWSLDKDFKLITFNQPFDDIVKLMSGKGLVKGSNILSSAFSAQQLDRFKISYTRAFAGETFTEIEHSAIPFEFWSEISYYPIRNGNEIIGTACHSRDITERRRTDEQLLKSEAFNRGVLNSLSSQIAVIDGFGNVVAINEAWKQFGIRNGKTILQRTGVGSNYYNVCSNSGNAGFPIAIEVLHGLTDVMSGKRKFFDIEYPCHSHANQLWFSLHVIKFDGDEPLVVMAHTDISARKFAELERVEITNDLIQQNRDLEQFSFIVSHNLRAPVANIIGLSVAAEAENLNPDLKKEIMTGLTQAAMKLDEVIIDLNAILQTKRDSGQKKEIVHFSEIANDIHASIENLIEKEKAILFWDFSEVDQILALKSYVHSIFYNLISNSLKYRQPEISPVIEIKSYQLKNKIELLFKDNGMGINLKEKGDKVFGLYKRFHSQVAEGKGMGLFLVKTQVESLGGKISIESEVNKGTTFKIEFKT